MGEQIRTFVAIELDDAIRRALGEVQKRLKQDRAAQLVRWVAPESIHITLKFLGDVDAHALPALQNAIANACIGTPPFALSIAGLGAFPNTRRPNVVWVGTAGQLDMVAQLAKKIDDACATLGFAREERAFTVHLTLGRLKRDASTNGRAMVGPLIEHAQVGTLGELRVDRVCLMKSELRPSGSVYTRLAEIQLTVNGVTQTK